MLQGRKGVCMKYQGNKIKKIVFWRAWIYEERNHGWPGYEGFG